MICRLCGLDKKLIQAHVIPRSFHRLIPGAKQPPRVITNVRGRYAQKVPKGVYDSALVCEDCERRFSSWDDYGAEILLKNWNTFIPVADGGTMIGSYLPAYDYKRLKLFFLSVLWRAAASGHFMFDKIDLGPREASLRDAIWNAQPGDTHTFGVVLQAFNETDIGMLNPDSLRMQHLRYCRIYAAHVIAFIKVDSQPFRDPLQSFALAPDTRLFVAQKDFMTSPENVGRDE